VPLLLAVMYFAVGTLGHDSQFRVMGGLRRFVACRTAFLIKLKRNTGDAPVASLEQPKGANMWLVEEFVRWLDGGNPMEPNVKDNLQSVAMFFAAVESGAP